jgi:hypothetical protein
MASAHRISIGFQGGQVLALRVNEEQWKALGDALGGVGWHQLESEDGPVRVSLGEIVYVSSDSAELRVGFG